MPRLTATCITIALTVLATLTSVGSPTAVADEAACSKDTAATSACPAGAKTDKDCSSCPDKSAAAKADMDCAACPAKANCPFPKISYQVGDQAFDNRADADTQAAASQQPVVFAVADKTFTEESQAMAALADASESFLVDFVTIKANDQDLSYQVVGAAFETQEKAQQAADLAQQAMLEVAMQYTVDGKEICCPTMAKEASDKCGKPVAYKVGDVQTNCPFTARVSLNQAKYMAAIKALTEKGFGQAPTAQTTSPPEPAASAS
ncbi:MAG: hypothetical protein IT443_13335 [Phycisphaeraceae bacterium]|nr:hypothetical protein [Phycisphaeraceae bacterium]